SSTPLSLLPARNFGERLRVGYNGLRNNLAIDELTFTAASDQPRLVQDLQMVRNCCAGHAADRDNVTTVHLLACRDGLEDSETGLVAQGFRYFSDLGPLHRFISSVANS